jgi:hypothetical protein
MHRAQKKSPGAAPERAAISAFANRSGLELLGEFNDAAVSGADHIETRPGFTAMLAYIASPCL